MIDKKFFLLSVLLVALAAAISGCTGQSGATVKTGDNVSVDYIGWFDNGTIFDTSEAAVAKQAGLYSAAADAQGKYAPLTFEVGSEGIISGFGNATIGMKVGESKNITLTPAEAYGEYDPSLILPVNMSIFTKQNITLYVNQTLYNPYFGQVRVDSIPNNTTVMIDCNNPMAGKTLHFMITVKSIQAASSK